MEWTLISDKIPNENDEVVIISKSGSGYNAIFKNNSFVVNNQEIIPIDGIMYWKKATGNFSEEMNKPCRACGRRR